MIGLAIVLILGLILRLISLGQSFWLDEAVQVWTTNFSLSELIFNYMPGDFNPPFYHLLTHFWAKLGKGEEITRLLPVALGVFSIYLIHKVAEEIAPKNEKFILFSALLLATSPLHIYYSQENRMYILALTTTLLAIFSHLYFWKKPNFKRVFLYSLAIILMSFSHFLTYFTLPIFFLFDYLNQKARKSNQTLWLFPFIFLVLSLVIYSPLLIRQLQTGMDWTRQFPVWGKTVGSFTLKAAALLPIKFTIGRIGIENKLLYAGTSVALVSLYWTPALLATFKNLNLERKKRKSLFKDRKIGLLSLLLIFPPLAGFLFSFFVPVFSYFRFLFVLPLLYLLIGWQASKTKTLFRPIFILFISINLIFSGIYLVDSDFHRENWRGMTAWLMEKNQQYQAPVIISGQIAKPFDYYNQDRLPTIYINSDQDIEKIYPNLKQTIYLVSYGLPIFDPEDKIRKELERNNFQMTRGESFRKVGIEEWRLF